MAFVEVRGITKTFHGITALKDLSLNIELGTVHVFAGENGAGKSTLIKALTGIMPIDNGTITIGGHNTENNKEAFDLISYVPQELSLFPNMTVAENLFMPFEKTGFSRAIVSKQSIQKEALKYIEKFNIHARPEQKINEIAISDQQLIQVARATTNKSFKVLILDEPTTSLTTNEIDRLFNIIKNLQNDGFAIVFVSHKLDEIFSLGTYVTVLRNGIMAGSSLLDKINQHDLVKMMSGEDVALDKSFQPDIEPQETVLSVKNLSGQCFNNISFELRRGEILGFAGLVGAGRSEIMQTIFGYLKADNGSIEYNSKPIKLGRPSHSIKSGIFYISEERKLHGILPMLSVRENIGISILDQITIAKTVMFGKERKLTKKIISDYDIITSSPEKKIVFLSGGNQQKVILGRTMACKPKILIFDEPTKGIDIKTKVEIYRIMKQLAEEGVSIILVSSEIAELRRCAGRILTIYHGSLSGEFITKDVDTKTLVGAILGSV